jgi:spore germination cell wall hydrolase CwlJ-like protein
MDFRDELYFLMVTVAMEASGEPLEGKIAVAFVICGRGDSTIDSCMRAYQFSSWNTESPTRMNLDVLNEKSMKECYKAACAAYFGLVDDPSKGATHYLNEEMIRKSRGGKLPGWFDEKKVTARIGNHTFLRLKN